MTHTQQPALLKRKSAWAAIGALTYMLASTPATADDHEVAELKQQLQVLLQQVQKLSDRIDQIESKPSDTAGASSSGGDSEIAVRVTETEERVDELEDSMLSIDDRLGERAVAQAFDGIQLDIGGFVHTTYTTIDAENGTEASFDRQNFELLIGAQLDEDWSAFFAGGFLRESDPSLTLQNRTDPFFNSRNKNPQIIGWVNYRSSNLLNVRIGRMITPHGIINIEHFPATLLDPEQPQFLRPFSGDTIFPNFATGLQLHGKTYAENFSFSYATYATNMSSNAKALQVGGRAAFGFNNDGVVLGFNAANGNRVNDADYDLIGLDFKVDIGKFLFKSEYYVTSEESIAGADVDRETFYIQPAYRFSPQWIGFTRYDILDMGDLQGESTEWALGLNYLPSPRVRLRAIYTSREYEDGVLPDADADILQVSGTFSF